MFLVTDLTSNQKKLGTIDFLSVLPLFRMFYVPLCSDARLLSDEFFKSCFSLLLAFLLLSPMLFFFFLICFTGHYRKKMKWFIVPLFLI